VYRFDTAFATSPVLVSSGHNGPSNLRFNSRDKILAVTNFNANSVDFVHIATAGVSNHHARVPHTFGSLQNYPNPFNAGTTISYEISSVNFVSLTIYDVLGRVVSTLVDGVKQPGRHTVHWDARLRFADLGGQASGIYFCRPQAYPRSSSIGGVSEDFTQMMKLVLLR
jgi:hypothetical protein